MADKLAPSVLAIEQETFEVTSDVKEDENINAQSKHTATTAITDSSTTRATPTIPLSSELENFSRALAGIIATTDHYEIWGVDLTTPANSIPTQVILQKFLNANHQSVPAAKAHLEAVLRWRAEAKPLELLKKKYEDRFRGMAYVTTYAKPEDDLAREVLSWNIYGRPEDVERSCEDVEGYVQWLTAFLELASQSLGIASANQPITADRRRDTYKMWRVEDAKYFHSGTPPPAYRRAWLEAGCFLPQNYPELFKGSFIVNLPPAIILMNNVAKILSPRGKGRKSYLRRHGHKLAKDFEEWLRIQLPVEYGGTGRALAEVGKELSMERRVDTVQPEP